MQRLHNGNTLITETNTGYVFEVTPRGETVWEFANPFIARDGVRQAIMRATRYRAEEVSMLVGSADGGRVE